jgi:hypothetical protein
MSLPMCHWRIINTTLRVCAKGCDAESPDRNSTGALGAVICVGCQTGAPDFSTCLIGARGAMNIDRLIGVSLGRDDNLRQRNPRTRTRQSI